jgi:hypothetical protein
LLSRLSPASIQYAEAFDGYNGKPLFDAYPTGRCSRNQLRRWIHYRLLGADRGRRSFRDRFLDRVSSPAAAFLTGLISYGGLRGIVAPCVGRRVLRHETAFAGSVTPAAKLVGPSTVVFDRMADLPDLIQHD